MLDPNGGLASFSSFGVGRKGCSRTINLDDDPSSEVAGALVGKLCIELYETRTWRNSWLRRLCVLGRSLETVLGKSEMFGWRGRQLRLRVISHSSYRREAWRMRNLPHMQEQLNRLSTHFCRSPTSFQRLAYLPLLYLRTSQETSSHQTCQYLFTVCLARVGVTVFCLRLRPPEPDSR